MPASAQLVRAKSEPHGDGASTKRGDVGGKDVSTIKVSAAPSSSSPYANRLRERSTYKIRPITMVAGIATAFMCAPIGVNKSYPTLCYIAISGPFQASLRPIN